MSIEEARKSEVPTDQIPISVQGADCLPPTERDLYESTLYKWILSLVFLGAAFMLLGFTTYYGSHASYYSMIVNKGKMPKNPFLAPILGNQIMYAVLNPKDVGAKAYALCYLGFGVQDLVTGTGFATFCEIAAALLALSAAIIISPWMTGTPQEKAILRSPKTYLNN